MLILEPPGNFHGLKVSGGWNDLMGSSYCLTGYVKGKFS